MRAPSIHINELQLAQVLNKVFKRLDIHINEDSALLARKILEESKGLTANQRSVSITNDKLKRDAHKVTAAPRDANSLFISLLFLSRKKLKHRGITPPKVGTPEFLNYKDITKLATEFANEFQLTLKEGYLKYIEIGLSKMQNYSLYKFKQLHEAIYKEYEAEDKIQNDRYSNDTRNAHDYYVQLVSERIGFCQGFEATKEKYACFVAVVKTAKEFGINPKTYIKAQFAGFDWRSGIPDPLQLNGIKAIERLQVFCYENELKLGKDNQKKTFNIEKIKKAGL